MNKRFIERESPTETVSGQEYLHTERAGAVVPFLQSVITGFFLGLALFVVLAAFRVRDAWIWALAVWAFAQAVTWLALGTHWFSLTTLERIMGRDINGDGVIGTQTKSKAQPRVIEVRLREVRENGHIFNVRHVRLLGDPEAVFTLATALLGGASFAERLWSGDGKLFSQDDFRAIKKILIDEKLLEQKNPKDVRQGFQLTKDGITTMETIRDDYSSGATPPPAGDL